MTLVTNPWYIRILLGQISDKLVTQQRQFNHSRFDTLKLTLNRYIVAYADHYH